ncbi:unnamed protein product [Medioppia subpectinata]|uniref:F-box domain-containing protein n=1 Tax=Medioppia subpectinata TaxID=1979941 RepID=A0A7R9KH55_9ACAR|nr:unnamed protein product [Medioppia subpectinata]CAG2103468.1 unnamed protein product [Medioppia subpectinata]
MAQQLTQTMASLETTDGCEDRQQPNIYAKNSMDRFGDDLCALLLSYLSFEDRFLLECVSKQFRRTVFESVVYIDINDRFMRQILKTRITETLATIAIKCPNIQTIDCREMIFLENRPHILEMLWSYSDVDYHRLSAFAAQNQSLKYLNVNNICVSEETLTGLSVQLSRLTQLRRLKLWFVRTSDQISVTDSLRTIGVNCKQLHRLSLLFPHIDSHAFNGKTLDSLRYYQRLKRLKISIYETVDEIVLDPLRHCKQLTHLELCITKMTANVLRDLHIKCPRLQYLIIRGFHNNDTECLDRISRLPALQMLVIHYNKGNDLSDNDFNDLLSRSPKLKTIKTVKCYDNLKFYCRQNN